MMAVTQPNVNVGRDNITNVTFGNREAGNSGGRIRAVTVSVEPVPIGKNLWGVKVNNGTTGPITDLEVDVYLVDETGSRSESRCLPAKGRFSLEDIAREVFTMTLSGGLGAIGQQAQSMYSGLPASGEIAPSRCRHGSVNVTRDGQRDSGLDELDCVDGHVWAAACRAISSCASTRPPVW